ncbi:MAG TPA: ATP-binding protein, partial [Coleofasciculaceae cyanobacterium]
QDFCFPSFLAGVTDLCRIKAEQKGVDFVYQAVGDLPDSVHADDKRLRQVLLNLLSNAVKFTQQGTVTFRVLGVGHSAQPQVTPPSPSSYRVQFQIEDTGVGIPEDQQQTIFLPFEQVGDRSQRCEGTGLGLTITRKLVAQMGGELWIESAPGVGSRFGFELELLGASEAIAPFPLFNPMIRSYVGKRRKVLVVDDRPDNRTVVIDLLEPLGFQLVEASDGKMALEQALQHQPDVIIADLVMPVMDGFELIQRLRQLPQFQETVIIASSASVLEFNRLSSQAVGFNDFLPKPIQAEELFKHLQQYLSLVWICDNEAGASMMQPVDESGVLTLPPSEDLMVLYEAAQIGHIERIVQEAVRLETLNSQYAAFAAKVRQLAEQFDDVAVVQLIAPHLKSDGFDL